MNRTYIHRLLLIVLLACVGLGIWDSGAVYADGGFDVPEVNDQFNQFEQSPPPQKEQPVSPPPVEEEKGFWDSVTQPISDAWEWTTDKISGAWEWTKEKASALWDWFVGVLSKITEVVVDALAAVWDWIVKYKEYIAFAGVLLLGIVLCIVAPPLGGWVLGGMAVSLLLGLGMNGWKFDKNVFLEAAIGGLLGLFGGGIASGVARFFASGIGKSLITGVMNSRFLGPIARGGSQLISKLPKPMQQILGKGGVIGAAEGAGTSVADDLLHGRKIDWKKALLSGVAGAALVGVGAFLIPKMEPIVHKVTTALQKTPIAKVTQRLDDCLSPQASRGYFAIAKSPLESVECLTSLAGGGDGGVEKTATQPTFTKVKEGEQFTRVNRKKTLKPNIEYTSSGYTYRTDHKGRIIYCGGTLKKGTGKRNAYAQRKVGGEDRFSDDDGGHLIASIFAGSGNIDNLVPMNYNLNRGEWKKLENTWADALDNGKKVEVDIRPVYQGDSVRPIRFAVRFKINDDSWQIRVLENTHGGE